MVPDGRTDGQTDGRTDDAKTISPRRSRGITNTYQCSSWRHPGVASCTLTSISLSFSSNTLKYTLISSVLFSVYRNKIICMRHVDIEQIIIIGHLV